MQLVDADAPAVVRYWPAAHDEHVTVPVATAFCPVAQPMKLVETDAPVVVRYWPEAHDVHVFFPALSSSRKKGIVITLLTCGCVARPILPSSGLQVDWE